jgi:2-polyprenyl-3-methyl-5-hydroxy-6-metoxy-1,4-benzoquinol methylase
MNQAVRIEAETVAQTACNLCRGTGHTFLFRKEGYDLVRCNGCALVFVANPPGAVEVGELYSADDDYHTQLFDPDGAEFARMRRVARQHLKVLRKSIPDGSGLSLLDIGCSSGLFLKEAREAGYAVQGVELSPNSSRFAREHFGLTVHNGLLDSAGFAPESFDVITLFVVIEHVPDPLAELVKIRDLLKPGGLLLQSTPNIDGLFPRVSYPLAGKLDYWPHPEPPHHLYQFSVETLTAMTAKAGFETGRVDQTRIDLGYSFGTPEHWKRSKKLVPYALLFAPAAILGPWIGMGDWFYLAARKPAQL